MAFPPYTEIRIFMLMLLRIGVLLFLLPVFNARVVPAMAKAGLSLLLTILLFPVVGPGIAPLPYSGTEWVEAVAGEVFIGMLLALWIQIFFEGVRLMGQLSGIEVGFAIANVIDPQYGTQASLMSNLAYLLALMLFLLFDGHHVMLGAIRDSFVRIHPGGFQFNDRVLSQMVERSGQMFVIGLQIAAPVIAAILFVQIAFGIITKLIPQMNVMIVAFPLQIAVGLFFFGVSLWTLMHYAQQYTAGLGRVVVELSGWMQR